MLYFAEKRLRGETEAKSYGLAGACMGIGASTLIETKRYGQILH